LKNNSWQMILFILALICFPSAWTFIHAGVSSTPTPLIPSPMVTQTVSPSATLTLIFTPSVTPSPTITNTPLPTLFPEQAKLAIKTLLQEPVDCAAPCFWGITAGKTTLYEVDRIFHHFRIWHIFTTRIDNIDYYESKYELEDGFSISSLLGIQDGTVEQIKVDIKPEIQEIGKPRDWLVYSPEMLIKRYGSPTKAEFFVGRGPRLEYAMDLYFDKADLIIEYSGYNVRQGAGDTFRICPVVDQQDYIRMWFGDNPDTPPIKAVPLETASSITLDEFARLMTGDPQTACVDLKMELFP
jgi:hypothetical protein